MSDRRAPPIWVRTLDILCLVLAAAAAIVAVSGGFRAHLGGNRHRLDAGRSIDPQHVAARPPVAHLRLEPLELGKHRVERRARLRVLICARSEP